MDSIAVVHLAGARNDRERLPLIPVAGWPSGKGQRARTGNKIGASRMGL